MIVKINKKTLLVLRNRTYIYTQFDAQNAGNSVSELPDFNFFWGGMPPDPLAKGALQPLVNNAVANSSQTQHEIMNLRIFILCVKIRKCETFSIRTNLAMHKGP